MQYQSQTGEKVPLYLFWQPPFKYNVPEAPSGHTYVPLIQTLFKANYDQRLMAYPSLAETIDSTAFASVINSANFVIKSPYFKYTFVRWFCLFLMVLHFIEMIAFFAGGDVANGIINLILLFIDPILMRLGGVQYLERMMKFNKVMKKAMDAQSHAVLLGNGIIVEPGDRCFWLDFHQGTYTPPPMQPSPYYQPGPMGVVSYNPNFGVVPPGTGINV